MRQIKIFILLLFSGLIVFISAAGAADIQKSTSTAEISKEKSRKSLTVVIGNKDTGRYHLPGMPYYNKVKAYHRVYFNSEQEALANGYYKAGTGKDLTAPAKPGHDKTRKSQTGPGTPVIAEKQAQPFINYKIFIAFVIFTFLFSLPFMPAVLEIIRKQDSDPLFIAMDYNKDPRYFCKSFKQIIQRAVIGLTAEHQVSEIMLSKKEDIQMTESLHIPSGTRVDNLLYVQGDMVSDARVNFNKEVYVSGEATVGSRNFLHVLAAEGNMSVAEGTVFERWLDSHGDLDVGVNCRLGISASCEGKLHLSKNCSFRRLYGMPVTTGNVRNVSRIYSSSVWSARPAIEQESSFVRKTESLIAEGSILKGQFVYLNDVRIGNNSVITGSIKCYGDVELEDNVTIFGNIFADGKITIGKGGIVSGHVFSQHAIHISENSVISRPGVIKSVLGKKSVRLASGVTIYGYISTEGKGRVV